MITFGPAPAIGQPGEMAKDTTGIFSDGQQIGAIYWIPSRHPTPWNLILHRHDHGDFTTHDDAAAAARAIEAQGR